MSLNRSLRNRAGRIPTPITNTPMMIARAAAPDTWSSKNPSYVMIHRNQGETMYASCPMKFWTPMSRVRSW